MARNETVSPSHSLSLWLSVCLSIFGLFSTFRLLHCLWHFACLIFPQSKTFLCDASHRRDFFLRSFTEFSFRQLLFLCYCCLCCVVLCCVGRICINKLIITSCCCCLPSTRCYHAVCDWHRERQATLDSGWKCQCIFICIASPLSSLPLPLTVSLFLSLLQLLPPFRATYSLFVKW